MLTLLGQSVFVYWKKRIKKKKFFLLSTKISKSHVMQPFIHFLIRFDATINTSTNIDSKHMIIHKTYTFTENQPNSQQNKMHKEHCRFHPRKEFQWFRYHWLRGVASALGQVDSSILFRQLKGAFTRNKSAKYFALFGWTEGINYYVFIPKGALTSKRITCVLSFFSERVNAPLQFY